MMIDSLKLRTKYQPIILQVRELILLPNIAKKGRECFKLNERIEFEFRPAFENGEFVGYSFLDIIIYPHYLHNDGRHNGNDFAPQECIKVLENVFHSLRIDKKHFDEVDVVNIEFGVNVIPEADVKKIVPSIKYWKSKPFKKNGGEYSLITQSNKHKRIKAYAKGIDDLERIKSGEVHLNTFRYEIKSNEKKFLKLKLADLFNDEVYNDFQNRLLDELKYIIFVDDNLLNYRLNSQEKKAVKTYLNLKSWKSFLKNKNRNKFNNERKKYELICAKYPTMKTEIINLVQSKFSAWKNSAVSTKKIMHQENENQPITDKNKCSFHLAPVL